MRLVVPDRLIDPLRNDSTLRIMLYSTAELLAGPNLGYSEVAFPQNMEVKLHGGEEVRWNHKGLKSKRGSAQPGDLTSFVRKLPGFNNDITIMYALTNKRFWMNVMLVKRSTPEELTNQLKTRPVISKNRVIRESTTTLYRSLCRVLR